MRPTLGNDILDVSNFDEIFTGEEAAISVIPDYKMSMVYKKQNEFTGF